MNPLARLNRRRSSPLQRLRGAAALAIIAGVAALSPGCSSVVVQDGAHTGPFFVPSNVRGIDRLPPDLRRVVVLPLAGPHDVQEDTLQALDIVLQAELTRTARFEVVPLERARIRQLFGTPALGSSQLLPTRLLERLQEETGADGVLLVDLTHYAPYPPLAIGVRAKLVQLGTGDILWAFDTLFSAESPAVANAARRHARQRGDPAPADLSFVALKSPSRFGAYVGSSMFASLPLR